MTDSPRVTAIGPGVCLVEHAEGRAVVYVAGPPENRWAFWNGRVFHVRPQPARPSGRADRATAPLSLAAPMPGTVIRLLVRPGATVAKGDPLVVLEAMKMELPIRAPADGLVTAVHCREGELVQADAVLVEFASGRPDRGSAVE